MLYTGGEPRPTTVEQLLGPGLAGAIDRLDVVSRKILAGKLPGERRSKRRGRSVEFDDFRDYIPGDDLRHIDWNVLARLDKLFIKLFREEEDLSLHLIVDASRSMDAGDPSKLVAAHRIAMALGYIGLVNQNRVLCSIVGHPTLGTPNARGVRRLAGLRGRRSVERLADFLLASLNPDAGAAPEPRDPLPLGDAIRLIASAASARGVVVILSDFLVPLDAALDRGLNSLSGAADPSARDLYAVQILAPGEIDPAMLGPKGFRGDLRLTDIETGHAAEVTISAALIKRYRERLEAHTTGLRTACLTRGIRYSRFPSDASVHRLLTDTLRRGGLLR